MFSLKSYNTFHIDAQAKKLMIIESEQQLQEVIPFLKEYDNKLIIGWGSNILFTQNFDGIVLINTITWKQIIKETDTNIIVSFGSGEIFNTIVEWSVENNYTGIENLISIPGTIGAAPVTKYWCIWSRDKR